MIRAAEKSDADGLAAIYNFYIKNTTITFEELEIDAAQMASRVTAVRQATLPWLVATEGSNLLGYAYAAPWHSRSAYRFTVEITIYLAPGSIGCGLGTALYHALFEHLRKRGVHTVIAVIALPNAASVHLHEKFGMKQAGCFREAGYKFGRWIDVGYWQILL